MAVPNTTNAVYVKPSVVSWGGVDSDGNINDQHWSAGGSSNASFATVSGLMGIVFSGNGSNREHGPTGAGGVAECSETFTMQSDHLYTLQFKSSTTGTRKGLFVWLEVRKSDGSWLANRYSYLMTSKGGGVNDHVCHISYPEYVGGHTYKLHIGQNWEVDDSANLNSAVSVYDINVVDHGAGKSAGKIYHLSPPAAKVTFDSGKIRIDGDTGALYLNGVQTNIKGSWPDWDGGAKASLVRHYAAGYNTVFQVDFGLSATALRDMIPVGMKAVMNCTNYANVDLGSDWFNNLTKLKTGIKDAITALGDDFIGIGFDMEAGTWDSHTVFDDIRGICDDVWSEEGEHARPLVGLCWYPGMIEGYLDNLDAVYPYMNSAANENIKDLYPQSGSWAPVDIQEAWLHHAHSPTINKPLFLAQFNTTLQGEDFARDVMGRIIAGAGGGDTMWRDAPNFNGGNTNHGYSHAYVDQAWWPDIQSIHTNVDLMKPAIAAPHDHEYNHTGTVPTGVEGVRYTLRVVGNEVWPMFTNFGDTARNFTLTMPDKIESLTDVWSEKGTITKSGTNDLDVSLQPYGMASARMSVEGSGSGGGGGTLSCKGTATPTLATEAGSTVTILASDIANGSPVFLTGAVLSATGGGAVTGATVAIVNNAAVITSTGASEGSFKLIATVCDVEETGLSITSHSDGEVLEESETVEVSVPGTDTWRLIAGSTDGGSDYFDSGDQPNSATSVVATGWPSDGSTVYWRLTSGTAETALIVKAPAGAGTGGGGGGGGGTGSAPEGYIYPPGPNSTIALPYAPTIVIEGGSSMELKVGSTVVGSEYGVVNESYTDGSNPTFTPTFTGIPSDGSAIYASFVMKSNGHNDHVKYYTYTAPTGGTGGGGGTGTTPTLTWSNTQGAESVSVQYEELFYFSLGGDTLVSANTKFGTAPGLDDFLLSNDSGAVFTSATGGHLVVKRPLMNGQTIHVTIDAVDGDGNSHTFTKELTAQPPVSSGYFYAEPADGDDISVSDPLNFYIELGGPTPNALDVTVKGTDDNGPVLYQGTRANLELHYGTVSVADMAGHAAVYVYYEANMGGGTTLSSSALIGRV